MNVANKIANKGFNETARMRNSDARRGRARLQKIKRGVNKAARRKAAALAMKEAV